MRWRAAVLVAALAAACSTPHVKDTPTGSAGSATAPSVISDGAELKAKIGSHVAVKGTARDAKISAAVLVGDGPVYCLGVASWPADVSGKVITAHGTLEHTDELAAKTGPNGEISQGTTDAVYVLRDCEYDAP
jgi:hypothetical protein